MFKEPAPRDAQRLVDEQVRKWEQGEKKRAGEQARQAWPLITVSREFGALGTATGERAAGKLGFSFWDQEIVHAIAEQTGIQEALLASLDEQTRTRIEDFIGESVFGVETTAAKFVRQLTRVVRTLDHHGGAVVIGRGAQFILAPEAALRVRVVCPYEKRIADYAERQGLTAREAERELVRVERERQTFIRRHYGRDVGDPVHYDIMINTEGMSPDQAADILVAAYKSKFGRLPEGTDSPNHS
jgi:cytidylate kinase